MSHTEGGDERSMTGTLAKVGTGKSAANHRQRSPPGGARPSQAQLSDECDCCCKMFRSRMGFATLVFTGFFLYLSISFLSRSLITDCRNYESRLTHNLPGLNHTSYRRGKSAVKVIAMSLYGADERYTKNAIRNAKLARKNFVGWKLRFYMEQQPARYYPAVPAEVIERLEKEGAEIVYLDLRAARIAPMLWRFLVADDFSVDVFVVRDADSLLTVRDAVVVRDWLTSSNAPFHCVRDHPSHAAWPVSGGMWGARRRHLAPLLQLASMECMMLSYGAAYLQDMEFVRDVIWPKVAVHAYCHDSVSCKQYPNSVAFPTRLRRKDGEHIGQVYDATGRGRPIDINIINKVERNEECEPERINTTTPTTSQVTSTSSPLNRDV